MHTAAQTDWINPDQIELCPVPISQAPQTAQHVTIAGVNHIQLETLSFSLEKTPDLDTGSGCGRGLMATRLIPSATLTVALQLPAKKTQTIVSK